MRRLPAFARQGGSIFVFDPRLIYTYKANNYFSLSVIPKVHLFFGEGDAFLMPGITLGFGLSSNLDKWALRPEVGYDGFLYGGLGFCYFVNNVKTPVKIKD
ncbi:MAG: hypothetical protein H6563_15175 [Lewinellaceae bacterium]|nr:hypothetical protein [Lewinellaceae bacterium]